MWENGLDTYNRVCLFNQCILNLFMLKLGRGEWVVYDFEFWPKHKLPVEVIVGSGILRKQETWTGFLMAGFTGSEEPLIISGWNIGSP